METTLHLRTIGMLPNAYTQNTYSCNLCMHSGYLSDCQQTRPRTLIIGGPVGECTAGVWGY